MSIVAIKMINGATIYGDLIDDSYDKNLKHNFIIKDPMTISVIPIKSNQEVIQYNTTFIPYIEGQAPGVEVNFNYNAIVTYISEVHIDSKLIELWRKIVNGTSNNTSVNNQNTQ